MVDESELVEKVVFGPFERVSYKTYEIVDESKLVEQIVCGVSFGPFERVNFIVYEGRRWEKIGKDYVLVKQRLFQDKETKKIISRSYMGRVEESR